MANNKGQGRKPKPTHLKLLHGEPNKKRINKDEPKPAPIAPKCPPWLSKEAKKEWRRLSPQLEQLGILTGLDMSMFAAYCLAVGKLEWAERQIKKLRKEKPETGGLLSSENPGSRVNTYVRVYNKSLEQIRSFGSEFGLSPSSRTKIKVESMDDGDDFFD